MNDYHNHANHSLVYSERGVSTWAVKDTPKGLRLVQGEASETEYETHKLTCETCGIDLNVPADLI